MKANSPYIKALLILALVSQGVLQPSMGLANQDREASSEITVNAQDLNKNLSLAAIKSLGLSAEEIQQIEADYDQFLQQLGFEDYAQEMRKNIGNRKATALTREVLKYNAERAEIFNISREISTYVMSRMAERLDKDSSAKDRLVELASRLLTLQPLPAPVEYPADIVNTRDANDRYNLESDFLTQHINENIRRTTENVTADIAAAVYGGKNVEVILSNPQDPRFADLNEKIDILTKLVFKYVERLYSDTELSQTRFLGRAMAASVVRYARLNKRTDIEDQLRDRTAAKGDRLDNYISSKIQLVDGKGKERNVKLRAGDFAMEYSGGREAFDITTVVVPTGLKDRIVAMTKNLYGDLTIRWLIPDDDKISAKLADGKKLTLMDKIRNFFSQLNYAKRSYSHVGMVDVKKATLGEGLQDIEMPWIWDSYPNERLGGIRLTGVEGFAADGQYSRVGFVKYDDEKLLKHVKNTVQKRGYQEDVWVSESTTFDKSTGEVYPVEGQKYSWKAKIDKDTFMGFDNYQAGQGTEFFEKEIGPRVTATMRNFMVGPEATAFAYGFTNQQGMMICSQSVAMSWLVGTNIDPQARPDRFVLPLRAMKAMKLEGAKDVNLKQRIIAPAGFAWQSSLVDKHEMISYSVKSVAAQQLAKYESMKLAMDRKALNSISKYVARIPYLAEEKVSAATYNYRQEMVWVKGTEGWAKGTYSALRDTSEPNAFRKNQAQPVVAETKAIKSPEQSNEKTYEARYNSKVEFLKTLGFDNYTEKMQANLQSGKFGHVINKRQIERNIKSYKAMDAARDLGAMVMATVEPRMKKESVRTAVIDLAAKFLTLQPVPPPLEVPAEIEGLPEDRREKGIMDYFGKVAAVNINEQARKITADIVELVYGEKAVAEIMSSVDNNENVADRVVFARKVLELSLVLTERMYMDTQIGQTRFLGRSMVGLVALYAQEHNQPEVAAQLKEHALKYGVKIENILGDTWSVATEKGFKSVKVETGSLVLTRNMAQESAAISAGAIPADDVRAKKAGLIGHMLSMFLVVEPEEAKNGMPLLARLRDRVSQYNIKFNQGMSHVGYALVRENANGIKMSWVVDNYPHPTADNEMKLAGIPNTGGVRLVGLENFMLGSHHSRFMVASYDKKSFYKEAHDNYNKFGYQPKVMDSIAVELDSSNMPTKPAEPKDKPWMMVASAEEVAQLHSIKDPQAFYAQASNKALNRMLDMMETGVFFQWVTPLGLYFAESTYCSQLGWVAWKQSTGVDIEPVHDKFSTPVHIAYKFGLAIENLIAKLEAKGKSKWVDKLKLKALLAIGPVDQALTLMKLPRIIAPSGLVINKIETKISDVDLKNRTIDERYRTDYAPYRVNNPYIYRSLDVLFPKNAQGLQVRAETMDSTEKVGLAWNWMHMLEATKGAEGVLGVTNLSAPILAQGKGVKLDIALTAGKVKADALNVAVTCESALEKPSKAN